MKARWCLSAVTLLVASLTPAADPKPNLDGTWLFDAARTGSHNELSKVWTSVVTVKGTAFTLTEPWGHDHPLTGRLAFDPADPRAVDLILDELEFGGSAFNIPVKIPAGTLRGLYTAEADRVTICFARKSGDKRPTAIEASETTSLVTLVRAPAGFKSFPKEITVRVTGPDGKPVAGADVGTFMVSRQDPKGPDSRREWRYLEPTMTGPDGTAKGLFREPPTVVRDAVNRRIAFPTPSPARLAGGELHVKLVPEHRITGRVTIERAEPAEPTHVLLLRDGEWIAQIDLKGGGFDFPVVPGTYTVRALGDELRDDSATVTVPANKAEVAVGPLTLKPSAFTLLRGKPAPELRGVAGWSGKPVTLADLKGQYVLVDFWGYWCGACVETMPVLIELHEKFAGKGLAIVGVHVDKDGEVDTAAKLDEKIAGFVKTAWKGKKLPFPNALVPAKGAGPPDQYGVEWYPTTILIDREGKVVGKFKAHEIKAATAEIEKLLGEKK